MWKGNNQELIQSNSVFQIQVMNHNSDEPCLQLIMCLEIGPVTVSVFQIIPGNGFGLYGFLF